MHEHSLVAFLHFVARGNKSENNFLYIAICLVASEHEGVYKHCFVYNVVVFRSTDESFTTPPKMTCQKDMSRVAIANKAVVWWRLLDFFPARMHSASLDSLPNAYVNLK